MEIRKITYIKMSDYIQKVVPKLFHLLADFFIMSSRHGFLFTCESYLEPS
jgi:hypothetical protein